MTNLKRNAAVIAASAIIASLGIGGVMSANADPGTSTGGTSQAPADGEVNDDATDTGPDANPNEPGHQDAADTKEASEANEGPEANDATEGVEGSDGEANDDASDTGPDANPNEPGHQDAADSVSDGDGETADDASK